MNEPQKSLPDLELLLMDIADGRADESRRQQLAELIRNNPEARRQYVSYTMLNAWLNYEYASSRLPQIAPDSTTLPQSSDPQPLSIFSIHRRPMRYALAASLILCFGVIASVTNMISVRNGTTPGTRTAIATLTDVAADAVFEHSEIATTAGSQLPGGFLRLRSGTAKVIFFSGAEVTLQGPCEFGINSEMRGYLKQGKLTAYVPQQAHGFTVAGPNCAVIDLGTRFTMTVGDSGKAAVEVIEGKVRIGRDGGETRDLSRGFAASIKPNQSIEVIKLDLASATDASVANLLVNGDFTAGLWSWNRIGREDLSGVSDITNVSNDQSSIYGDNFAADHHNRFFQYYTNTGSVTITQAVTLDGGDFTLGGQFAQRSDRYPGFVSATFGFDLLDANEKVVAPAAVTGSFPPPATGPGPHGIYSVSRNYRQLAAGTYTVRIIIRDGQGVADNISLIRNDPASTTEGAAQP